MLRIFVVGDILSAGVYGLVVAVWGITSANTAARLFGGTYLAALSGVKLPVALLTFRLGRRPCSAVSESGQGIHLW
jgi:hypothetical protein